MSRNMLVSIKKLAVSFPSQVVLEGLSLSLLRGEALAVVGANGCGKSTLLNVLLATIRGDKAYFEQEEIRTTGQITFRKGTEAVCLPQHLRFAEARPGGAYWQTSLGTRLSQAFNLDRKTRTPETMSDGELQKAALIETLLTEADLYLFDEPTNYLDIDGITAFEDEVSRLKTQGRGIILVTHDRALTENLADFTVLISQNGVFQTKGGFEQAWSLKTSDVQSRRKQASQIKRKINQLQDDMRRKAVWASNKEKQKIGAGRDRAPIAKLAKRMAKRAKVAGRKAEKEIARLKEVKPFVPKTLGLRIPEYAVPCRQVFSLENVAFSYPSAEREGTEGTSGLLLHAVTLRADTTDSMCLMGPNGCGKSTLVKLIAGQIRPTSGRRSANENVRVAYLPQGLVGFFVRETLLDNFLSLIHI